MLTSMGDFLRYFGSINRRAMRDVGALPPEAEGWAPAVGEGEQGWSVNRIVAHMAQSRGYFVSAYRGEGWIFPEAPDVSSQERWLPALEESGDLVVAALEGSPDEWLRRKIDLIDTEGTVTAWRLLMMMVEHDVHHRSQIDTYAGLNRWEPPQIYDRAFEDVEALQPSQKARYRSG